MHCVKKKEANYLSPHFDCVRDKSEMSGARAVFLQVIVYLR
jgi:hypothetical protein